MREGTAEEVAGWKRGVRGICGVSGTRDHWSWEGTGKPGRRHGGENKENKNK